MLKEQKMKRDDWRLATLGVVAEVKNKVCQAKAVHVSVVCQIAYITFMFRMAEFILETENRLGRESRLPRENSSYMNLVKDEFSVLNLSLQSSQSEIKFGSSIAFSIKLKVSRFTLNLRCELFVCAVVISMLPPQAIRLCSTGPFPFRSF